MTECALAIRDSARGERIEFGVEVRDENQIDVAAAASARVVVDYDDPDPMLSLGADVARLLERFVAAAEVPPISTVRARSGESSDAGCDAAQVQVDPGENSPRVLQDLADENR